MLGFYIEERHYNVARLDEVIKYSYSQNGRLTKESIYLYDNRLKGYNLYTYSFDGLLDQEQIYTTTGLDKNAIFSLNLIIVIITLC